MVAFSLTANNEIGPQAVWKAVPLGRLEFPQVSEPYDGAFDDDFWPSRHEEYNRLEWDAMDWNAIRSQMNLASDQLEKHPDASPDLEFDVPSIRERTFLEMWFGYGDPSVEATAISGERTGDTGNADNADRANTIDNTDHIDTTNHTSTENAADHTTESTPVRYRVGYGQHRICAYADYPMGTRDRNLMRIPASGFLPTGPLSPETRIPVLTH
ncbi:hypothetical protein BMYO_0488 [Bifidobacterium myosotis]|uniref:Uncharacterized protein n=1 Tax=Bifidobacterium myosotis TaxID=1630166 RepID=A0A261FPX5_9BIFI|nr:hypothetical protein [Bifidobacterium myosotis]OZG61189.1 hypothetical protein BMYO_0488 [Bifidobacterium myosotis]